ncbi:hypothetical protein MNBD_NITROSPINAE05-9 [hydrothermal vent metagenome]|uniref:Lcl C-terminal domain-containing protein n=1 Tax=hydrothermal vent metagenome TaxID=652676 RepID=A0A3B1CTS0_9ZZZZ
MNSFPIAQNTSRSIKIFFRVILLTTVIYTPAFFQDAFAASRFENKGEVVVDSKSGLMWQNGDSYHEFQKGLNWYEALEYMDGKNAEIFAGHNDWRLPTLEELNGLWDASRPVKSKDGEKIGLPGEFKGGGSYYLWTSNERGLDNVWYFGLGHKENYFNLKDLGDLDQGVKLVRKVK